jgi:hypothetical protein
MSRPKLKPLYVRVPQVVASALLVIGLAASAQQSSDKPAISRPRIPFRAGLRTLCRPDRWHNAAAISFARRWMSDRNRGYSLAVGG